MAKHLPKSNNHLMYLAILALSLLLVPFFIQKIQSDAVARYQASYAAEQSMDMPSEY